MKTAIAIVIALILVFSALLYRSAVSSANPAAPVVASKPAPPPPPPPILDTYFRLNPAMPEEAPIGTPWGTVRISASGENDFALRVMLPGVPTAVCSSVGVNTSVTLTCDNVPASAVLVLVDGRTVGDLAFAALSAYSGKANNAQKSNRVHVVVTRIRPFHVNMTSPRG